jgi:hypothetical protein
VARFYSIRLGLHGIGVLDSGRGDKAADFYTSRVRLQDGWNLDPHQTTTVWHERRNRPVFPSNRSLPLGLTSRQPGRYYAWACPNLVTNQFLETIRPWLPSSVGGIPAFDDKTDPANARILKLLEEHIPVHFRTSTTLEDLVKHVKDETTRLDGQGIPIYVDPIGLQEAERSMTSTVGVRIDLDHIPLKSSLHYCLRQLQLVYRVKHGFLQITADNDELPINDDSFLIVGHCLFGLIATALGGAAGPLVAGEKGSP